MSEERTVHVKRLPIELHKLLKLENLAASGGEAKEAVAAGMVRVNGEIETRKRKKIYSNDLVELGGLKIRIAG
jgi:ribosome-associated protein